MDVLNCRTHQHCIALVPAADMVLWVRGEMRRCLRTRTEHCALYFRLTRLLYCTLHCILIQHMSRQKRGFMRYTALKASQSCPELMRNEKNCVTIHEQQHAPNLSDSIVQNGWWTYWLKGNAPIGMKNLGIFRIWGKQAADMPESVKRMKIRASSAAAGLTS